MIDHVSIPVADLARSSAFYDAALEPLGLKRKKESDAAVGYGSADAHAPSFWILAKKRRAAAAGLGLHISFEARDRDAVDAFFAQAVAAGAKGAGDPGTRPEYTQPFYGAFAIDPDGFKIEAVCRTAP